jgi:hypothetical protein
VLIRERSWVAVGMQRHVCAGGVEVLCLRDQGERLAQDRPSNGAADLCKARGARMCTWLGRLVGKGDQVAGCRELCHCCGVCRSSCCSRSARQRPPQPTLTRRQLLRQPFGQRLTSSCRCGCRGGGGVHTACALVRWWQGVQGGRNSLAGSSRQALLSSSAVQIMSCTVCQEC